jgi:hypothetical protein
MTEEAVKNSPELTVPQMVNAHFDESGKLGDSEIVAFAGCAGTTKAAWDCAAKWTEHLKVARISYTSMKDAIHLNGPYAMLRAETDSEKKRDALLRTLARTVADSGLLLVAAPMTSAEFKSLPSSQRARFWNDLQYCGLEACISGVLHQGPNFVLHVTCDISEQYAQKCVALFNKLRSRDPLIRARCFAITFADDTKHVMLQVADMIAYCSRAEHLTSKKPEPIITELIETLRSPDQQVGSYVWRPSAGPGQGEILGL